MMMLSNRMLQGTRYAETPKVTLVYSEWSTVNSNTWTLTGINFGPLATGQTTRHLIAVVTCQSEDNDDFAFTMAVTIGGVSATVYNTYVNGEADTYDSVSGGVCAAIVEDNTNASGNVVVTIGSYVNTMQRYGIMLLRAVGLNSSVPTTQPTSSTLVVPTNGFGVLGCFDHSITTTDCSVFAGSGAINAYHGTAGAAMYRTTSGSVSHTSTGASAYRGATWTFIS